MRKYIWLFGENNSNTHSNNSYYFWEQVYSKKDCIDKYFILSNNKNNRTFYNSLNKEMKKRVVWKNSLKHLILFKKTDMYFVSLSYKDILPEKILFKKIKLKIKKPLIYLQHGTLAIKKLGYAGNAYNNCMLKFLYYNPDIKERFMKENDFNEYQMYYGEFHPRYKKTVELYNEHKKQKNKKKKILFFITWREYFDSDYKVKKFINKLNKVFENEKFKKYIEDNKIEVNLYLHQFYTEEMIEIIEKSIKGTNIKLLHSNNVDVMQELVSCDLLITDYSSVGFDCTFLNIPVILFQPDSDEYFEFRESYYSLDEINKYNVKTAEELVDIVINKKYKINQFFKSKLPKKIDYDKILKGEHIERMYNDFYNMQLNKITILGYNFSGKGGTVSATKALAEALLEKGYLVELLSLKVTEKKRILPYGLALNGFYDFNQNKFLNLFKRKLFRNKKKLYYLNNDINKNLLIPYIGKALKKYLKKSNDKTIISTRESIHLFVKKFANENVTNKIYFFHTDSKVLNNCFPDIINLLKEEELENCAFVTNSSRNSYVKDLGYDNYKKYVITGNTIESKNMIKKEEIELNSDVEDIIKVLTLMRFSNDRKKDIDNIILFGNYLKENKIDNIVINAYGPGDMVNYFIDEIYKNNLDNIINYLGVAELPKEVILENTCVVDFCDNQSFGMTYIESILNGKMIFAKENVGSLEVLKDIPNAYYHSNEELLKKIINVTNMSKEEYEKNYDIIYNLYSRDIISKKIIDLLK